MSKMHFSPRIGIYGIDNASLTKRRAIWGQGCAAAVTAAGGTPIELGVPRSDSFRPEPVDGLVFLGAGCSTQSGWEEKLCQWCCDKEVPFLGIDGGMHLLNTTHGGALFQDLSREMPQALQHRHPPERGLRHAIQVNRGTRLAQIYGDGEIVVNSEHRAGVSRPAPGFRVSAKALDGVIEAIEAECCSWFAIGVQWQPAAASASVLDIQLFRGLVEACHRPQPKQGRRSRTSAA